MFGISQFRDSRLRFIVSEGTVVAGPLLKIGNTTSRMAISTVTLASGATPGRRQPRPITRRLAPGTAPQDLAALAELLGIEMVTV